MSKKILTVLAILIPLSIVAGLIIYGAKLQPAILVPSGEIARRQYEILRFAFWLSMIVIIPVFGLLIFISLRYRASKKAKYTPDWAHNNQLEAVWWGIPIVIILILSIITWRTSHTLDPYKPLDKVTKPLEVQVVSLQWKWLFIYPEQNIATINYLKIPKDTPINLKITSDAPMNSFWIPKLAGQIYAMNGMSTKLHIIANEYGDFEGYSANISGEGFADMKFLVNSSSPEQFESWANVTRYQDNFLSLDRYKLLSQPSTIEEPEYFSGFQPGLYNTIIEKYMPMYPNQNRSHHQMESY